MSRILNFPPRILLAKAIFSNSSAPAAPGKCVAFRKKKPPSKGFFFIIMGKALFIPKWAERTKRKKRKKELTQNLSALHKTLIYCFGPTLWRRRGEGMRAFTAGSDNSGYFFLSEEKGTVARKSQICHRNWWWPLIIGRGRWIGRVRYVTEQFDWRSYEEFVLFLFFYDL